MIIYYTILVLLKNILYKRAKDENNSFQNMSTPVLLAQLKKLILGQITTFLDSCNAPIREPSTS